MAETSPPRPGFLKTPCPDMGLTSLSQTSGYPGLGFYRCVYLVRVVQNCFHTFDHRLLQPDLYLRRPHCITLDDHLVVADENRYGTWTLVPTLPQEGVYVCQMH
jgi:hypothetical protein